MLRRGFGLSQNFASGGRWRLTAVAALAALVGTCALVATVARAQEPPGPAYQPITVHSPKGQEFGRWAERTRVAGDLNHDGVNDLWVGVPRFKRDDRAGYGRVYAVDGASLASPQGQRTYPKILYKIHPPEPQLGAQFGFFIENLGDLNGDGTAEIVVGTDAQDVPLDPEQNSQICDARGAEPQQPCRMNQGKAWVFDGKNNRVLYDLNNPRPQGSPFHDARFGSRLGRAGDVTGDGVSEIIAGASGNDNPERPGCADDGIAEPGCRARQGQAFIFDGKDGALVRELNLPKEDEDPPTTCQSGCGSFGNSVQGPGDVDGDGTADQLVGAPSQKVGPNPQQGRMYVFSGKTGDVIRRVDDPEPEPFAQFGFQDVTPLDPGDVNRDGRADLYGAAFEQDGEAGENGVGKAWVFSGGEGNRQETPVEYELVNKSPTARGQFGWSMTRDRNRTRPGDPADDADPGTNPLYVGNAPHGSGLAARGDTNTFNAETGAHLRNFPLPLPWAAELRGSQGPALGWTVASPGDLDRDGFREFLAGAPFTDVCHIRLGRTNKDLHVNQGVMIAFRSGRPSDPGDQTSPDPSDGDPVDNDCTRDQQGG